jgi:hypothetical protein
VHECLTCREAGSDGGGMAVFASKVSVFPVGRSHQELGA